MTTNKRKVSSKKGDDLTPIGDRQPTIFREPDEVSTIEFGRIPQPIDGSTQSDTVNSVSRMADNY